MANKMNKKDFYAVIMEAVNHAGVDTFTIGEKTTTLDEVRDFIAHECELLDKRNTDRKPTKNQRENAEYAPIILEYVQNAPDKVRIADILANVPEVANLSTQRVSAILKTLVERGAVQKVIEKRVSYWMAE